MMLIGIILIRANLSRMASSSHSMAAFAPIVHVNIHCWAADELLNEELFDTLDDARRKLALWRYDYNNVRPHSSLEYKTPAEASRALQQFEGAANEALAQPENDNYQPRRLSL